MELGVRMLSHTASVRVYEGGDGGKEKREERKREAIYRGWGREHKRNTSRY